MQDFNERKVQFLIQKEQEKGYDRAGSAFEKGSDHLKKLKPPLTCNKCGHVFNTSQKFKYHLENVNCIVLREPKELMVLCYICAKKFSSKQARNRHIQRVHSEHLQTNHCNALENVPNKVDNHVQLEYPYDGMMDIMPIEQLQENKYTLLENLQKDYEKLQKKYSLSMLKIQELESAVS